MGLPPARRRPGGRGARRAVVALSVSAMIASPVQAAAQDASETGAWSAPFAEPTINGKVTDEVCLDEPKGDEPEHDGTVKTCKPTATSIAVLGGDEVVYWNGLEDTEEVENGIVFEYGKISTQDQVRRLDLGEMTWTPSDPDAGEELGDEALELIPGTASQETYNDDVLFCAALTYTLGGQVMTVGGTTYYAEPDIPGTRYGVAELQGSKATRLYDPATNRWFRSGDMAWGRWYPTLVPLADGQQFVAGGVSKLIKPLYTDREVVDSGRNVVQTETWSPATGEWTENGDAGDRTLPLYARLHLLPGGGVYYNAAGQVFNPSGQAYDEALWNMAAVYDPATKSWSDLGIPGFDGPYAGFRGSTTSVMLPLRPDEDGNYTEASFLQAGGILGVTPGTYFAIDQARIDTVDTTDLSLTSEDTGSLNAPRWYGQSVLLPTGEVMMFNGASADEVVGPGTAIPVMTPELWNPETGEWTPMADQSQARTYHNSAALLPDGTVLVGGHDPISTAYASNFTLLEGTTTPNETRNPNFEIFQPPYLFRGEQPVVKQAPNRIVPDGSTFTVTFDNVKGDQIESVMLMRKTAITHLVDGGQRAVELPIVSTEGNTIKVKAPTDASVAPAGPYLLFANRTTPDGPVPSEAAELVVEQGPVPTASLPTPAPLPLDQQLAMASGSLFLNDATALTDGGALVNTASAFGSLLAGVQSVIGSGDDVRAVEVAPELAFHEGAELRSMLGMDHGDGHVHIAANGLYLHDQSSAPIAPVTGAFAALLGTVAVLRRRLLPVRSQG